MFKIYTNYIPNWVTCLSQMEQTMINNADSRGDQSDHQLEQSVSRLQANPLPSYLSLLSEVNDNPIRMAIFLYLFNKEKSFKSNRR